MADHWNPRLAAPSLGAWLWSFSLFFIMNRAIVASLTRHGRHGYQKARDERRGFDAVEMGGTPPAS
jgi:hypothetical protein